MNEYICFTEMGRAGYSGREKKKKKTWREMGQYADCKSSLIGTNVIYK